jgi:hypothetical protein
MITLPLDLRSCDVCRLLDNDFEQKLCQYCGLCDAWICEQDTSRWGRRLLAAAKRKLEPAYKGLPNYVELAEGAIKDNADAGPGHLQSTPRPE